MALFPLAMSGFDNGGTSGVPTWVLVLIIGSGIAYTVVAGLVKSRRFRNKSD